MPVVNQLPGVEVRVDAARPDADAPRRGDRPRPRRGLLGGVRLPAAGGAAGHLPAHAGVPAAHGDHDRRVVPVRRSAPCTWRTRSASTGRSPRRGCRSPPAPQPASARQGQSSTSSWTSTAPASSCGSPPRRCCARQGRQGGRGNERTFEEVPPGPTTWKLPGTSAAATRPCRATTTDPPLRPHRQGVRLPRGRSRTGCGARPASRRSTDGCLTRSPSRWRSSRSCSRHRGVRSHRTGEDYAFSLTSPRNGAAPARPGLAAAHLGVPTAPSVVGLDNHLTTRGPLCRTIAAVATTVLLAGATTGTTAATGATTPAPGWQPRPATTPCTSPRTCR